MNTQQRLAEIEEAFLLHVALVASDPAENGDREAAQARLNELTERMKARLK